MATYKTEFRKYIINKKKDDISIYLHGNKIYNAVKDKLGYITIYSAPNNRWMNENNIRIDNHFENYNKLRRTLALRLFSYLPEDENENMSHSIMPPVKFRTVKDKVYFEVQIYDKWYKLAVIQDHPLKHCPERWTIKFYNVYNLYTPIGVNHCDSTQKVIDEFLTNIHIEYFPPKLKAWMEARTLAKSMVATLTNENERAYSPSNGNGVYTVQAQGRYIGSTTPLRPVKIKILPII